MRTITGILLAAIALASSGADAQVTSNFGYRSDPFHGGKRMHAGMDMGGRVGMPIYATGDGFVRRSRWAGGYGILVELEHGFGYQTRFGHLSRSLVQEGQFVRRGQMIALMGSTGRSTGPHLHYEVRIGGRPVQPADYMQIVFNRQPDWNAVRVAAMQVLAPARAAPSASVAMAIARPSRPSRRTEDMRTVGDLEIDYGTKSAQNPGRASSFGGGHVTYRGR